MKIFHAIDNDYYGVINVILKSYSHLLTQMTNFLKSRTMIIKLLFTCLYILIN